MANMFNFSLYIGPCKQSRPYQGKKSKPTFFYRIWDGKSSVITILLSDCFKENKMK